MGGNLNTRFEIARKNWPLVQSILEAYNTASFFTKLEALSSDQVIVFELRGEIAVELFRSLKALAS